MMSRDSYTTKHTPGPWKVVPYRLDGPMYTPTVIPESRERYGACLAIAHVQPGCGVITDMASWIEAKANARLIAAAPELFKALKLLHDNLAEYQRINNIGGYDNHDMKQAREAMAKVTDAPFATHD